MVREFPLFRPQPEAVYGTTLHLANVSLKAQDAFVEGVNNVLPGNFICQKTHQPSHPFGIFYGDNPLSYSFPLVLLEISFVVIATRIVRFVLKPLRQPRIVSEILVS